MNALQLKNSIIQKIAQIDDIGSLKNIQDIINDFLNAQNIQTDKIPSLSNNKTDINNDKENFNDYIKEWLKEM